MLLFHWARALLLLSMVLQEEDRHPRCLGDHFALSCHGNLRTGARIVGVAYAECECDTGSDIGASGGMLVWHHIYSLFLATFWALVPESSVPQAI